MQTHHLTDLVNEHESARFEPMLQMTSPNGAFTALVFADQIDADAYERDGWTVRAAL